MTGVKIVPAGARDAAMHDEQCEQLRRALEVAGYDASVDVGYERRSVEAFVTDVAIHVGEILTADGLVRMTATIRRYLRGLRSPTTGARRQAVIYGPNGQILRRVDLPADDDA